MPGIIPAYWYLILRLQRREKPLCFSVVLIILNSLLFFISPLLHDHFSLRLHILFLDFWFSSVVSYSTTKWEKNFGISSTDCSSTYYFSECGLLQWINIVEDRCIRRVSTGLPFSTVFFRSRSHFTVWLHNTTLRIARDTGKDRLYWNRKRDIHSRNF